MGNFNKTNNIIGWVIFLITTAVYVLTLEPTASWWDPGEFIATTYKLQVGHPPGAPTYALLGRIFTLFAFGNTEYVPMMINMMSAIATGASAMFFYWIIVMFGLKIVDTKDGGRTNSRLIAVIGSGIIGALAAGFSDSTWFSAVEAEVYALSTFFTAVTFWLALKWESVSDQGQGLRYLVFLFFLIGLAIGVHLLNLLAIPAVFYIVYFKKYKATTLGFILTGILSVIFLGSVLFGVIPTVIRLFFTFDYAFVNIFGLPFNSGAIFYFVLLIAGLSFGIYWTQKKQRPIFNAALLGFAALLIGFSTFFVIVIRANANPPINENDPKDASSLLSYLNREQYGSIPSVYGPYYNAPIIDRKDLGKVYAQDEKTGKYKVIDENFEHVYDPAFMTIFPRMWSNTRPQHIDYYKSYGNVQGRRVSYMDPYTGEQKMEIVPTFGENLTYFFRYQLGHMYWRYFLWNFVGRQNDIESQGEFDKGNWKSGIPFIDNARLGEGANKPSNANNPGSTAFFFLPFILGIIGLIYHYQAHRKDAWIITVLFLMTGVAIVVYINQHALQPRERDYSYAASFMAFCIWIGLGVYAIYDWMEAYVKDPNKRKQVAVAVSAVTLLLVPGIMLASGWELHSRSKKTSALDWAKVYLNSCAPNAVIFANGDNDTFPLWYAQEVEGIRTDVRVVNYMLSGGAWYCHQMGRKVYESEKLPLTLKMSDYDRGTNDQLFVQPKAQDRHVELSAVMKFVASDDARTFVELNDGKKIKIFPSRNLKMKIDKAAALSSGTVPPEMANRMVDEFVWNVKGQSIIKNELLLLDFLAANNWERPIYFINPASVREVFPLDKYMHREGMAFRLRPYEALDRREGMGGIDVDRSKEVLLGEDVKWGNLNDEDVVVDRESVRNSFYVKEAYRHLASGMVKSSRPAEAVEALDKYLEFFPGDKIPYDQYMINYVQIYYEAGAFEKGNKLSEAISNLYLNDLIWFQNLSPELSMASQYDQELAVNVLQNLVVIAQQNGQIQWADDLHKKILSQLGIGATENEMLMK